MEEISEADTIALLNAIAAREGTANQISQWYGVPVSDLREFVETNKAELERLRAKFAREESELEEDHDQVSVAALSALWISDKTERLKRYQQVADDLYADIQSGNLTGTEYSTALREFRSYLASVANELGQLLHRGSGETGVDSLSVDIQGVDLDKLR